MSAEDELQEAKRLLVDILDDPLTYLTTPLADRVIEMTKDMSDG